MELKEKRLDWLLETEDIGVAYLARKDLRITGAKELAAIKRRAHREGPIATILDSMQAEGYWVKPGAGYNPKYRSSVWAMILLAQLGASLEMDKRLATACNYMLEHALAEGGQFSWKGTSSCTIDCLQGNLCLALWEIGCRDPRLDKAFEWMARSETGEGLAPREDTSTPQRYYFTGKCGPVFACSATHRQPCAWGAVKVMLAFSRYPAEKRTPLIERGIRTGVDFLFSVDPLSARYPTGSGSEPSGVWWKFGFPLFYGTDLLQLAQSLADLGYASDPRLASTLNFIRDQQDTEGRWKLDHHYNGKTWIDCGPGGRPNKWVTLRALRLLGLDTAAGRAA
jgi:hypothetical protein